MVVSDRMEMAGSVSGGCIEGAVVEEAIASMKEGRPRMAEFGVSHDRAWEVGLTCGGKVSVFVESLDEQWWGLVSAAAREDRPMGTAKVVSGESAGAMVLVSTQGEVYCSGTLDQRQRSALTAAGKRAMDDRLPSRSDTQALDCFADPHLPRPRLILVGGAHIAMPLQDIARRMGYRVVLIDPRSAFATRERFPLVDEIIHEYPQTVLPDLKLDPDTYVAVLTHDPKIDDGTLLQALPSPAPYIGVLSSRKTHEKRKKRLLEQGLDPELLERLRTPIGIDLGGRTPEEVALAIMAEIVSVRNQAAV